MELRRAAWAFVLVTTFASRPPAFAQGRGTPTLEQVKNLAYAGIYDQPVTLKDGRYDGPPFVKDSPMRPRVGLVEALVERADLDRNGKTEAAVVLWESSGGSGSFLYLAIVGERGGTPANVATARIGDRVQIRSMTLADGRIVMDVVAHGPTEPMCCPTQKQRRAWAFAGASLKELPVEVTGTVGLADLEGTTWTLAGFDGNDAVPAGVEVTLMVQGSNVAGSSGCNRYSGTIAAGEGAQGVRIGPLASTRMACPPPRDAVEAKYLAALQQAFQFTFAGGSLALTYRDGEALKTLRFSGRAIAKGP